MRFSIELLLENEIIPKDKNRLILSFLKHNLKSYDLKYYTKLYGEGQIKAKDFTFSLFMKDCKFLREDILIPEKKIIMNFTTYNYEDGIMFFNSILSNKGKPYSIGDNAITIQKVSLVRENPIYGNEVIYKILSPIVVREHKGNNKNTWYHSLNNEKGQAIFMDNLQYQLKDIFGERGLLDFQDLSVEIAKGNREVKVKNYGIEVLSNIGSIKIKSQPYILDYLYKAGIGSKRGSGFGMLDIV